MSKKYKVPKCPFCGVELNEVREEAFTYGYFNKETGEYDIEPWDGSSEVHCPNCDADLSKIFPCGVANFKAKVEK
jgi:predicted RNA-binding Zn-ribbon protein involved in translation (DUF1610 family)